MARNKRTSDITVENTNENITAVNAVMVNTIKEESKKINKKIDIPRDYRIPVKSNVVGELIYKTKTANYEWGKLGDVEYISFGELITMRNTNRKYFENNWITFEDSDYAAEDVYHALNVENYYAITKLYGSIEDIFNMPISKMESIAKELPTGLKENVISLIKEAYDNGDARLDSRSAVNAFEKAFGISLVRNI